MAKTGEIENYLYGPIIGNLWHKEKKTKKRIALENSEELLIFV